MFQIVGLEREKVLPSARLHHLYKFISSCCLLLQRVVYIAIISNLMMEGIYCKSVYGNFVEAKKMGKIKISRLSQPMAKYKRMLWTTEYCGTFRWTPRTSCAQGQNIMLRLSWKGYEEITGKEIRNVRCKFLHLIEWLDVGAWKNAFWKLAFFDIVHNWRFPF